MRKHNYILKGKRIVIGPDLLKWGKWFQSNDRHIDYTELKKYHISTVFMGLDHRFAGTGAPILFETMVFENKKSSTKIFATKHWFHKPLDDYTMRYTTYAKAEKGHKGVVKQIEKL